MSKRERDVGKKGADKRQRFRLTNDVSMKGTAETEREERREEEGLALVLRGREARLVCRKLR